LYGCLSENPDGKKEVRKYKKEKKRNDVSRSIGVSNNVYIHSIIKTNGYSLISDVFPEYEENLPMLMETKADIYY
jgi:hypothetical protein